MKNIFKKITFSFLIAGALVKLSASTTYSGIDYLIKLNTLENINETRDVVNNVIKLSELRINFDGAGSKIVSEKLHLSAISETINNTTNTSKISDAFLKINNFGIIIPTTYGVYPSSKTIKYEYIYTDSKGIATAIPTGIKVTDINSGLIFKNSSGAYVVSEALIETLYSSGITINQSQLNSGILTLTKNFSASTLQQLLLIKDTLSKSNTNIKINSLSYFQNNISSISTNDILYILNGDNYNIYQKVGSSLSFVGSSKIDTVVGDVGALDLLTQDIDESRELLASNNENVTVLNVTTENVAVQYQRIDVEDNKRWVYNVKSYNNANEYTSCVDMYNSGDGFASHGGQIYEKVTYNGGACYIDINTNRMITKQQCYIVPTTQLPTEITCEAAVYNGCGLVVSNVGGVTARTIAMKWNPENGARASIGGKCFIKKGI